MIKLKKTITMIFLVLWRARMLKRLKHYLALRKARKNLILLGKMIDSIDRAFTKKGISRQQRRQFWYDFVNRSDQRAKFINDVWRGNGI